MKSFINHTVVKCENCVDYFYCLANLQQNMNPCEFFQKQSSRSNKPEVVGDIVKILISQRSIS
jgi:hypothetical protein